MKTNRFTDHPSLATCEIGTFRYRVLHVAARITRGARQLRLRIDITWRWASAIAWHRLRKPTPALESPPNERHRLGWSWCWPRLWA